MISNQLKEIRKIYRITQSEMAEQLNVAQGTVANWEVGRNFPTADMLELIADTYRVPMAFLFGRIENPDELYPSATIPLNISPNTKHTEHLPTDAQYMSDDEKKLLERFRKLDDDGKEAVLYCALAELRRLNTGMQESANAV